MRKKFDYALILIDHLKQNKGAFVELGVVAKKFRLPGSYLEKVAQELKRAGWLESRKGAGGGYRLAKNPAAFSIGALINFYEPIRSFCPLLRSLKK
ncbi:MAG: Rrf2 family transcriptional regulator [bacterium]|nr:Rrf2 family transcriptional regulator [bacterium]